MIVTIFVAMMMMPHIVTLYEGIVPVIMYAISIMIGSLKYPVGTNILMGVNLYAAKTDSTIPSLTGDKSQELTISRLSLVFNPYRPAGIKITVVIKKA